MDAITFDIKGIKCDNKACGWSDMKAKFDPDFWLNKPCPECGSNLFTQADYNTMMKIFKLAKIVNVICWPITKLIRKSKVKRIGIEMNGSGVPEIREES